MCTALQKCFHNRLAVSLKSNKNIKLRSSIKSSENIQIKESGPDSTVSNIQYSSVTLNELAINARERESLL